MPLNSDNQLPYTLYSSIIIVLRLFVLTLLLQLHNNNNIIIMIIKSTVVPLACDILYLNSMLHDHKN